MDIFRLPKYAAYFYESQMPPEQRIVLHPATIWSMGDRSGGGNDPLVIFSNCDEIEIYIGDDRYGQFEPKSDIFSHLDYPPYMIEGLDLWLTWGQELPDLKVIGYLDGKPVAERKIASDGVPSQLILTLDDELIEANGVDMTRLVFRIADRYGNRLPYANQVIQFDVTDGSDKVELIGENPFALIGGQAALYIKSKLSPGAATIRASTARLAPVEVTIRLD